MDNEITTEEEYNDFVENGDWYLDTLAPDYSEKLYQDMKERGTLWERLKQTFLLQESI